MEADHQCVVHGAEPLVGAHRAGAIEFAGRQTGADHGEAIEPGLGSDGSVIALIGEDTVIVDGPRDVFRHLVLADDLADPFTDLLSTLETAGLAPCCCGYCFEQGLGGPEQLLSLAGAILGQQRIAADHETLPGVGVAGDLHQVCFIEQRHLHVTVLHQ